MGFSKDFLWGAATAAYQIEGAATEDGRGPSIWDTFSHTPGNIKNGDTGDVACDHYHRYKEDISLMMEIGLQAYRFSISWSRVLPNGTGASNEKGLDFYDRLVDELLSKNIQPCATLFHWDMPQALHDLGAWKNDDSPEWFSEYADLMGRRLGDRVLCWMTFNEMCVTIDCGYRMGVHAPGEHLDAVSALSVSKNMQLAHGRGVQALRTAVSPDAQIGIAHTGPWFIPASDSPEDIEATRRAMFKGPAPFGPDAGSNALYLDPIILARPAEWAAECFGDGYPQFSEEELEIIAQPLDFLGLNLYHGRWVTSGPDGKPVLTGRKPEATTHFGWGVTPDALYWAAKMLYERYGLPILVTENGMSNDDSVDTDGKVHDNERVEFLGGYLLALRRAVDEGTPILGYMQWSLMDNFEWAEGYSQRFGLIHVDCETQKRTLKDSALWYKEVIASHGENL